MPVRDPRSAERTHLGWDDVTHLLRRRAGRRIADAAAVEDLVQGVLYRVLAEGAERDPQALLPRLIASTRHAVIDHYRARAIRDRLERLPAPASTPEDEAWRGLAPCVAPLLATLPTRDAADLRRIDLGGKSQSEVAALEGVPRSTIKARVQRARQRLSRAFDDCCDFEMDGRGRPQDWTERNLDSRYAGVLAPPRCSASVAPSP